MVDKIKSVDAATQAKKVKETELKEKEAKTAAEVKQADDSKKSEKTDSFKTNSSYFADYQIESYVKDYVNRLIAKFEGDEDTISRLRSYLGNFDIDNFRKDYPDLGSNSDLAMAMYNDTSKLLY